MKRTTMTHRFATARVAAIITLIALACAALSATPARAATSTISDQASCEAHGGILAPGSACRFYTDLTVAAGDTLQIQVELQMARTFTINGTVDVLNGGAIDNYNTVNNNGSITVATGASLSNPQGTFTNNGTITVVCGGSVSGISGNPPIITTACPTNTPVPPTNTPVPLTNTPVPPTNTPVPPTSTPTNTPTNTPVPPTDTPTPTAVPTIPAASVLDTFDRANGTVGSSWEGLTDRAFYRIARNQLDVQFGGPLVWKQGFGSTQEAFLTLATIDSRSPSLGLLLKVQDSRRMEAGALTVVYDAKAHVVRVSALRVGARTWTFYPTQAATFANADVLGGRVRADGTVAVYQNGTLLTTVTLNAADQAFFNAKGGRIGIWTLGAPQSVVDDFGGGTGAAVRSRAARHARRPWGRSSGVIHLISSTTVTVSAFGRESRLRAFY